MSFADIGLLTIYQTLLLCVAITAFAAGLYRVRKWAARYRQLPRSWQLAAKKGFYSATRRFVREEWGRLVLLVVLLLLLASLTIAIRYT